MKVLGRLLAVGLMTVALTAFVACGSDSGDNTVPKTDVVQGEDIPVTDQDDGNINRPDEGGPVETDEGNDPDVGCVPECGEQECGVDPVCGTSCGTCDEGFTCNEDNQCEEDGPCVPLCGNQQCGLDPLCSESCGTCDENSLCNIFGNCDALCDWETEKPDSWSTAAAVTYLYAPDKNDAADVCYDYTGDGVGDSGLSGLASQINPALVEAIEDGDIGILFEFTGVEDFVNSGKFTLNGLLAEPIDGEFAIDPDGYIQETCRPMIFFEDTEIVDGFLSTPRARFGLSIPLNDEVALDVNLRDAIIQGTVTLDEGNIVIEDGILAGALTKDEIEAVLAVLQADCDNTPEEEQGSLCGYLGLVGTVLPTLFDVYRHADGTYEPKSKEQPGNAISVCFQFKVAQAVVRGFEVAEEEETD